MKMGRGRAGDRRGSAIIWKWAGGGGGGVVAMGGESRVANSDRGLVLGVGGSRITGSRARPRRDFFS